MTSVTETDTSFSLPKALVVSASPRRWTAHVAARLQPNESQCIRSATSARLSSSLCRLGRRRPPYTPLFGAYIRALMINDIDQQLTKYIWNTSYRDRSVKLDFSHVSILHYSLIGVEL
jgi:hypothetical protein